MYAYFILSAFSTALRALLILCLAAEVIWESKLRDMSQLRLLLRLLLRLWVLTVVLLTTFYFLAWLLLNLSFELSEIILDFRFR